MLRQVKGLTNLTAGRPGQVLSLVGLVLLFCIALLWTSEKQGRASHMKIYLSALEATLKFENTTVAQQLLEMASFNSGVCMPNLLCHGSIDIVKVKVDNRLT